jgi:hypothetical protein
LCELPQRKLKADGEEQENNTDPCQCLNLARISDEPQPIRAHEDPSQKKANDGWEAKLVEEKDDTQRDRKDQEELC